jgi:transcriptional regulator with XRE-family HTH domain
MDSVYYAKTVVGFIESRMKSAEGHRFRGENQRLARAANCQPSYLSQVLQGNKMLTPDQAAGMAVYWRLDSDETEFLLLLLQYERSATSVLKKHIRERLTNIVERKTLLNERLHLPEEKMTELERAQYCTDWLFGAVHMALSIPEYRTVTRIAERLGVGVTVVEAVAEALVSLNLAERKKVGLETYYNTSQRQVHIPNSSPFCISNHRNFRLLALNKLAASDPSDLHYTAIHAMAKSDIPRIREVLIAAIEETRSIVAPSPEEDLVCVVVDVFSP